MRELTKKEIEILQGFKSKTLHDIENDLLDLLGEELGDSVAVRVTREDDGEVIYEEDCGDVSEDLMLELYDTKDLIIANIEINENYYNDDEDCIIKTCIDFDVKVV